MAASLPGRKRNSAPRPQDVARHSVHAKLSWMPDGRHIVVALAADVNAPTHLWMADIKSNNLTPLTTGTLNEVSPVVAPDGKRLLYSQQTENMDIVSVPTEDRLRFSIRLPGKNELLLRRIHRTFAGY